MNTERNERTQRISPTLLTTNNCSEKSSVHKRQLKPMNAHTFKLYPLDNDFNDLSSDVTMFGVADYNPSVNDTSRYVFA